MHTPSTGISVLICTCNGSGNLPETVRHLAAQRVEPGLQWEIILINNASTDDTAAVAGRLREELFPAFPFTVADEPQPGKDRAMDKGLALAQYGYVLVCDDDNWLAEDYVQQAFEVMTANPRIGMLGGKGIPFFGGDPPAWFGAVENYYAVGQQNPQPGELTTSKGFLWGAGAVINRQAYRQLMKAGFQRIITHARYPGLSRTEDVELCLAIKLAGYAIWYDECLTFRHYIAPDKLTWSYLIRLTKEGGLAGPLVRPYQELIRHGASKAPFKNFWLHFLLQRNRRAEDLRNLVKVNLHANEEGNMAYHKKLGALYYFYGLWRLRTSYNHLYHQVALLREKLVTMAENASRNRNCFGAYPDPKNKLRA